MMYCGNSMLHSNAYQGSGTVTERTSVHFEVNDGTNPLDSAVTIHLVGMEATLGGRNA